MEAICSGKCFPEIKLKHFSKKHPLVLAFPANWLGRRRWQTHRNHTTSTPILHGGRHAVQAQVDFSLEPRSPDTVSPACFITCWMMPRFRSPGIIASPTTTIQHERLHSPTVDPVWLHDRLCRLLHDTISFHQYKFFFSKFFPLVAQCDGLSWLWHQLLTTTTTTTTTLLWPFIWDYPREPLPEETFTHSHLS